jgi:hypothetical protein
MAMAMAQNQNAKATASSARNICCADTTAPLSTFDCSSYPGITAHKNARAASIGQSKKHVWWIHGTGVLGSDRGGEETGTKRLVQLAEKAAGQKGERGCVSASLLAAKARADVDGHTKEKAEEITAAFLNAAKDEILGGMKAPFAMHGMKASGPPASVHKEVQVNMRTRFGLRKGPFNCSDGKLRKWTEAAMEKLDREYEIVRPQVENGESLVRALRSWSRHSMRHIHIQ